jgi:hypothetical protein
MRASYMITVWFISSLVSEILGTWAVHDARTCTYVHRRVLSTRLFMIVLEKAGRREGCSITCIRIERLSDRCASRLSLSDTWRHEFDTKAGMVSAGIISRIIERFHRHLLARCLDPGNRTFLSRISFPIIALCVRSEFSFAFVTFPRGAEIRVSLWVWCNHRDVLIVIIIITLRSLPLLSIDVPFLKFMRTQVLQVHDVVTIVSLRCPALLNVSIMFDRYVCWCNVHRLRLAITLVCAANRMMISLNAEIRGRMDRPHPWSQNALLTSRSSARVKLQ